VEWKDAEIVRLFIASGGDPSLAKMGFGTWVENITTWTIQQRFPLLMVRYENLKKDAAAELRRMLAFLGEDADDARVRETVEACSFEKMRALEVEEKSKGHASPVFTGDQRALDKNLLFMSTGGSGRSLRAISPQLDEEFDRRFKVPLWLMGYA
jgi:hypothetical protein